MTPPTTIAHYNLTGKLGEGGMGTVYRATDTKLHRDVAVKLLPDAFAEDPDRLARFQREAQVLASLNHPNIAAIYGLEERALVLELVEGPTLADRIAQGPIPLAEALPLIHQLIDALEYAHEKGIIHRDLKPANLKLTSDHRLKVLDFGLAKAFTAEPLASAKAANSPTLTMRATVAGMIMGTAAYMAPEQARGSDVDKRADIWAFGVVVYEMLTARQLFSGPSVSDTLAAVLTREPESSGVPPQAQRLLRACLEKDAQRRLRDIGDARRILEETPAVAAAPPAARRSPLPWIAAVALLASIAAFASWTAWRATRPVDRPLSRLSVDLGPDAIVGSRETAIVSPDGTRIVFTQRNAEGTIQLATRTLDQTKNSLLPGTEGSYDPFFSPDGQWVGFFAGGKMKKVSALGGASVELCLAPASRGAAWGDDGRIIVSPGLTTGLLRIPDAGGKLELITNPSKTGEVTHRWPQILPGGQSVLFTGSEQAGNYEDSNIEVLSLKTGQTKIVHKGGYFGRYLPTGHLVYIHQSTLFAVAFDLDRLETRRTAIPVLDDVAANPISGAGQFDFSRDGKLIYVSGTGQTQGSVNLVDSAGNIKTLLRASRLYLTPRFSPDGKHLAVGVGNGDLWVYDIQRDSMTQLTFKARIARSPAWTPDGKHIALSAAGPKGGYDIWWVRADGGGEPQVFDGHGATLYPSSFSPDGKHLAYSDETGQGGSDIWILPLDLSDPDHARAGPAEVFLQTPASEREPAFSPDGRWIAYTSDESGSAEVYVRAYGVGGAVGHQRVSPGGGKSPTWSRDGRQIYYFGNDDRVLVTDCAAQGDSFSCSKPRRWSDRQFADPIQGPLRMFDRAPDGSGFALVEFNPLGAGTKGSVHVTFLLNFFDDLRRRVPGK